VGSWHTPSLLPEPRQTPAGVVIVAYGSKIDRHGAPTEPHWRSYGLTVTIGPLTSPGAAS
jgi:hypothetical protein